MNCNDFELKIMELARGQLSEAGARAQAVAHAAACGRCNARLRDEQRLTAGMRDLAASFADERMPRAGEARLLAAFRAEHAAASTVKRARRHIRWAAAAAVILVLVALAALRFTAPREPRLLAAEPATLQQRMSLPERNVMSSPNPGTLISSQQASSQRSTERHSLMHNAPRRGTMARSQPPVTVPVPSEGDEPASEIATSFIALDGGRGLARPESLQMVRVEMSRSALVSFGLPMNVERADERIKADVLVGDDGVARAIRFVR